MNRLLPLVAFFHILCAALGDDVRPPITGVAHIAFFTRDIDKTRAFYRDFLGFSEVYSLPDPEGGISVSFFKINERQYVELFPEREEGSDRLNHISIETTDAEAMRIYLLSRGISVPPKVNKGRIGNLNFNIRDPDGHTVEIVQYAPDGWTIRENGKALAPDRISTRLMHVGIIVTDLEASTKFYHDVLGFEEIWRGGRSSDHLNWVNMRVPDGTDYIEFMLYPELPLPAARKTAHHLCLEVPDVEKAKAAAQLKAPAVNYDRPMEVKVGINRKRQINFFDPDGTRIEVMEPNDYGGKAEGGRLKDEGK